MKILNDRSSSNENREADILNDTAMKVWSLNWKLKLIEAIMTHLLNNVATKWYSMKKLWNSLSCVSVCVKPVKKKLSEEAGNQLSEETLLSKLLKVVNVKLKWEIQ